MKWYWLSGYSGSENNSVEKVFGFEISENNVFVSKKNADENGVSHKTQFMLSDSYCPINQIDKEEIDKD